MADPNSFCPGDSDNNLLRKILNRLASAFSVSIGTIQLTPEDFEIGAVELKDADTDDRVAVINSNPAATRFGVVTRNIPSGVQDVNVVASSGGGLTDAELRASPVPVSNTPVQNSGKTVNRFVLSQAAVPGTTVIAAASVGNKHKIVGVLLTLSTNGTVKFIGTADLTGAMDVAQYGGFVIPPNPTFPWIETTATNLALSIVTTGGGANGVILYITEP